MAILYHPQFGAILVCDYDTGFRPPEMVKKRPVVVITPRLRRRQGLCTVVPLSTTDPEPRQDYHVRIRLPRPLPKPWNSAEMWAKCDMLATVAFHRLSPIGAGRGPDGRRRHLDLSLAADQIRDVQVGVLHALHLGSLTVHL